MRDVYFDNLKMVLIGLVVVGHFLLPLEHTRFEYNLFYLIYTFHMPCFVMVSGFFAKGVYRDGEFRADKLLRILWLYVCFKLLVHVTEGMLEGHVGLYIDFFTESGAPWYLLSMAAWYVTIPVVSRFRPGAVLLSSLAFSLFAGYQDSVGYFMSMTRTIAFAPFFFIGYFADRKLVYRLLDTRYRLGVAAAALTVSLAIFLGAYDFLSPYASVVYGTGYGNLNELYKFGPVIRLAWYGVALLLSLGLMVSVPRRRNLFSVIGQRTLQVYILHRPIRDLFQYFGFYELINVHSKIQVLLVVAGAALLTLMLGNRLFADVFGWISELPQKWMEWWGKSHRYG